MFGSTQGKEILLSHYHRPYFYFTEEVVAEVCAVMFSQAQTSLFRVAQSQWALGLTLFTFDL